MASNPYPSATAASKESRLRGINHGVASNDSSLRRPAAVLQGVTLLFLDVAPGTEFGLDMATNVVGDKFPGAKLVPAGLHFVSMTGTAPTSTGFEKGSSAKRTLSRRAGSVALQE
ncbi:hypothetical protein HPB49_003216 [Dermacentor silvarum]|uniref:Uncharacterized protein n=1 Tax=Dermacentor silvarum TaxID=543639 RepID=A0ACB8D2M6_DERSI|nr:hypothetical protein HPB49_003216 [Dermacentor silvarum]